MSSWHAQPSSPAHRPHVTFGAENIVAYLIVVFVTVSLYLVVSPRSWYFLAFLLGIPASAYLFSCVFERPFLGTKLIFLTLPITVPLIGELESGMSFFNIRLSQIIVLLTLLALGLRFLIGKQDFVRTPLRKIFFLYVGACLLSMVNSRFPEDTLRFLIKFCFVNAAMYCVVVNTVVRREQLLHLLRLVCWGGIVVAFAGFAQLVLYYALGVNWFYFPENPSPTAFFTEYGWYGIYLSIVISFVIPFMLSRDFLRYRVLFIFLFLVSMAGIAISLNRGAWISTAVVLTAALLFIKPTGTVHKRHAIIQKANLLLLVAVGVSALAFAQPQLARVMDRFDFETGSVPERLARLAFELDFALQHPWIGNGAGTHGRTVLPEVQDLGFPVEEVRGGSSLNIFMGTFFETGFSGLAILLALIYLIKRNISKALREAHDAALRTCVQACALALVCVLLNSQLNPVFTADFSWAFLALTMVSTRIARRSVGTLAPSKGM